MTTFVENLSHLDLITLHSIAAEPLFTLSELNDFSQHHFQKYFSQLNRHQVSELISTRLTVYDLSLLHLQSIVKEAFEIDVEQLSHRFLIDLIGMGRQEAKLYIENLWKGTAQYTNPRELHVVHNPDVITSFATMFLGFHGQNQPIDGIKADCALLQKFAHEHFPGSLFHKLIATAPLPTEESILFDIRHFFECCRLAGELQISGVSHACVVLSGHGNNEGNLEYGDDGRRLIRVKDVLDQWHRHHRTFTDKRHCKAALILVCDYCNAGCAVKTVAEWPCQEECCAHIIVQTSCAPYTASYDHLFLPSLLSLLNVSPDATEQDLPGCDSAHLHDYCRGLNTVFTSKDGWEKGASSCMCCNHTLSCGSRHHCRMCKGMMCDACTNQNRLFGQKICVDCAHHSEAQKPQLYTRWAYNDSHPHPCVVLHRINSAETITFYNACAYEALWRKWQHSGLTNPLFDALVLGDAITVGTSAPSEIHSSDGILGEGGGTKPVVNSQEEDKNSSGMYI